ITTDTEIPEPGHRTRTDDRADLWRADRATSAGRPGGGRRVGCALRELVASGDRAGAVPAAHPRCGEWGTRFRGIGHLPIGPSPVLGPFAAAVGRHPLRSGLRVTRAVGGLPQGDRRERAQAPAAGWGPGVLASEPIPAGRTGKRTRFRVSRPPAGRSYFRSDP